MAQSQLKLQELLQIFQKTLEDKTFSRSEKKAVTQLLEQDFFLKKEQRDFLRGNIFDLARQGIQGHDNQTVIDWLETATKLLVNCYDQDSAVYFSPGEQCRRAIVNQLTQALSSLDICVFTISDDWITGEILNCHKRGLKVRIITDDEKVHDYGSDIETIKKAGIEVRVDHSPHHMHHKFAIFDKRRVLTGSYNWTHSAAAHNQENVLLTDDKQVVSAYSREFEKLWINFKEG
jgi:phosphatidylserine/phosphatidylglycerophosphate/cardiolipin synthase-like enzyme